VKDKSEQVAVAEKEPIVRSCLEQPCSHLLYNVSFSLQQYDRLEWKTTNTSKNTGEHRRGCESHKFTEWKFFWSVRQVPSAYSVKSEWWTVIVAWVIGWLGVWSGLRMSNADRIGLPRPFVVDRRDIDFYRPRRRQQSAARIALTGPPMSHGPVCEPTIDRWQRCVDSESLVWW